MSVGVCKGFLFVLAALSLAVGVSAVSGPSLNSGSSDALVGDLSASASVSASASASVTASGVATSDSSVAAGVSATTTVAASAVPLLEARRRQVQSPRVVKTQERRGSGPSEMRENAREARETISGRIKVVRDASKAQVERLKQRREEIREGGRAEINQVKERRKELRQVVRNEVEQVKERREEVRKDAQSEIRVLKQERQQAVMRARNAEAELAAKVRAFKSKAFLNESERAELEEKARLHVNAAYNHRIELAKKMEAEGANATLVAEFVAYTENNWVQYVNASNNSVRQDLIVAFNHRWRDFKKAVAQDLLKSRLALSVNASRQILARFDSVIAKLSAGGFNTTALVNASLAISARLDSVLLQSDVPSALAHLRSAHSGLLHLRDAIQRTVNRELVQVYQESPVPSVVVADDSLSISGATDASAIASSPLTVASVSPLPSLADASVSESINASASVG